MRTVGKNNREHAFCWARALAMLWALALALAIALPALSGCAGLRVTFGGQEASIPQPSVNSKIYNSDITLDEGPVAGGALRVYATRPDTMNPLLTRNAYTQAMLGLIYGSLVRIGDDLCAEPELVEGWEMSEDGMMWAFNVRQGLRWHDGEPFTASDVMSTIKRIRGYGDRSPYADLIRNISSEAVYGGSKLVLTLKKPNAYTPETLVFPIVPTHVDLAELDDADAQGSVESSLIGTGPYKCSSYRLGDYLELAQASDQRRAAAQPPGSEPTPGIALASGAAQPPYLDSIRFIFHSVDDMALAEFRAGSVDAFFSREVDYSLYKYSAQMQLAQYSEREFYFVAFNCAEGRTTRNVRNALARFVDRDAVVDAMGGRAIAAEFPVQPESSLYDQGIAQTPYDPQAARLLLEGAGYRVDKGRYYDMSRSRRRLMEVVFIVNGENEGHVKAASVVAGFIDRNGVYIQVEMLPQYEYEARLADGDFDMAMGSYRVRSHPDMTEMYAESPYFGSGAQANIARYSDGGGEVGRLSAELFMDYAALDRQMTFSDLTAAIRADMPYIGLFFRASALVAENHVRVGARPTAWDPLGAMWQWYVVDY